MKKAIFFSLALALMLGINVASADVFNGSTGEDSNNDATKSSTQSTIIVNENGAEVENNVNASANSGDNDTSVHSGGFLWFEFGGLGGDATLKRNHVNTGDAATSVDVENNVNGNDTEIAGDCGCGTEDVYNENTGEDSDNTADLTEDDILMVANYNGAEVENKVNAGANTGDNDTDVVTGFGGDVKVKDGDVNTGNAGTDVFSFTTLNVNKLFVN